VESIFAIGSSNDPDFSSVEISVVRRDTAILADVAAAVQRLLGRRTRRRHRQRDRPHRARPAPLAPRQGCPAGMAVMLGEAQDQMNRLAR
jgi:hypothetical protein